VLYFNVINDGNGRRTWMYVDDVSVNLCGHQARFDPTSRQVSVGQSFNMDVRVESISDLYGFETTIRFDPAILEVVDADGSKPGVQVNRGAWLPGSAHIVINNADNGAGRIDYAATLVAPAPALNGSGNLVSIPFRAKAVGSTPVSFYTLRLVNSGAQVIPISRSDGSVTVTGNQATLSGQVLLEGRTNHSGTVVQLDGGSTVTTGADGRYTFTTTGGSHTLLYTRASYLRRSVTVSAPAGGTTTVPTVTLLAGDINGDNIIDILDLSTVGANFNSSSPSPAAADVNGDGTVDIVDIVLVAKNFNATA
jgi:minor extracellular serine protease Vpr